MKHITLILVACFLMLLMPVQAQESISVTLFPGWTWIPYLKAESMDIEYAMSPVSPEIGDVIKSQASGLATYTENGWVGSLSVLEPGHAYHYLSRKTIDKVFTYPTPTTPTVTTASVTMIIFNRHLP